jgi:hypothetical protein
MWIQQIFKKLLGGFLGNIRSLRIPPPKVSKATRKISPGTTNAGIFLTISFMLYADFGKNSR